jgi:AraC-like DNA-binding protein
MGYSIDLKAISLLTYCSMLKAKQLQPSRRQLHQGINGAFARLQECGFDDAEALLKGISTPKKIEAISRDTGLSSDYLGLLK